MVSYNAWNENETGDLTWRDGGKSENLQLDSLLCCLGWPGGFQEMPFGAGSQGNAESGGRKFEEEDLGDPL